MRGALIFFCLATALRAAPVAVPVDVMTTTNRALVRAVTGHYTFHRQCAPRRFVGRLDDFTFLLDNMGACAVLAYECGLSSYRPAITPDGQLVASDQEGAAGSLRLVDCRANRRVYYVEGAQRGTFTAQGRAVVVVDFREIGPGELEYTGTLFIRLDNAVAAVLTRLFIAFVSRAADRCFDEVMRLPTGLVQLAWRQPSLLRAQIQVLAPEDYWLLLPFAQQLDGAR